MIDLAHRLVRDADTYACRCGSEWNYLAEGCSSIFPLTFEAVALAEFVDDTSDYADAYFECRQGHAFCGRH